MDAEARIPSPLVGSSRSRNRRVRAGKRETGYIGQASWLSSVVNLLNTIIGSGVLAMPLALARMGMTLGVADIVWAGLTAGFGLYLQACCAKYVDRGSASFFALSQLTYPNAAVVFDAAIAIKCFGVGVSYLIIIGDLMPDVVQAFGFDTTGMEFLLSRQFWVTAFMLVVIPLAFLKRLDSLKYTSVIALTSIGYLIILVVAHFVKGDTKADRGPIHYFQWQGIVPTLSSFPVIVFGYTCHQNMFAILNEIGNNSHFRTTSAVIASIGTSGFTYVLVAVTGYLSFGDKVGGNIVSMYPQSFSATVARAAIVVLVMFSYPLQVHPCRASIDAVLKWKASKSQSRGNNNANSSPHRLPLLPTRSSRQPEEMSDLVFSIVTTVIIILSYITAMTVSSLEAVLAYVGSTGSTSISFILPGLFYYKISDPNSPHHQRLMKDEDEAESNSDDDDEAVSQGLLGSGFMTPSHWKKGLLRKLSLGLVIYGVIVMIVCLGVNTFFVASH